MTQTQVEFGSIEGTVRNAAGRHLEDVAVFIKSADQPHPDIAALSGRDGTFRLTLLLPGSYVLEAVGAANSPVTIAVRVMSGPPTRIDVVFPPG
ncbi:MAG TPA: carboxypeptidase-like regulatory domain-containing protein [Candidatus Eisenbacteria bacterium]